MRITAVVTLRYPAFGRIVWVHVHTDEGIVGLGEAGHNAQEAEHVIHDYARRFLLGTDPRRIDRVPIGSTMSTLMNCGGRVS